MQEPLKDGEKVLTIRTVTGQSVSATLQTWIQGILLTMSPDELVRVMNFIESQPRIVAPVKSQPADPLEFDKYAWEARNKPFALGAPKEK